MTILKRKDPLPLIGIDEEIERLTILKQNYEEKKQKYFEIVALTYPNINIEELFDKKHNRRRTYVYARYMLFFFLVMVEKISPTYLGRLISMHHSTIRWGIEDVFNAYDTNIEERELWNRLIGKSQMDILKQEFSKNKRIGKNAKVRWEKIE